MTSAAETALRRLVGWYATVVYGKWEGPDCVPFYCDPKRIGRFAVPSTDLALGGEAALFRLLVTLSFYQSRRDVDMMKLQREMPARRASALVEPKRLGRLVGVDRCELLADPGAFDTECDVRRDFARERAVCQYRPRTSCHVKEATMAIGRMGYMGKIPTSVLLHLQRSGSFAARLAWLCEIESDPQRRATAMVEFVSAFYRIGEKLGTLFVSLLSAPELAPGLTPWWPALDGSQLVVVDANVSRAIDVLRPSGSKTYAARAEWLRRAANRIDLTAFRSDWPSRSPRLVQQAVYWYCSKANRDAQGDGCGRSKGRCEDCVADLCPFS